MTQVSLRRTRPPDLPRLAELYERAFGETLSEETWHWRYERIPGVARSAVAVDSGGEIVAHAGMLRLPAVWRGGEAAIWFASDWVGSTGGRGLRAPLVDLCRWLLSDLPQAGDVPWMFGFPSPRMFRLGSKALDYEPLPAIVPHAGEVAAALGWARGRGSERRGSGLSLDVSDHCGEWAEAIWQACAVGGIRRSAAFLNWRYHARPGRYYRFYRVTGGSHESLVVAALLGRSAAVTELWVPPGADPRGVLGEVARDLTESGVEQWFFWPPPAGPAREVWLELGQQPRQRIAVTVRGRLGATAPAIASEEFYFAMGDYDVA